MKTLIFTLSLSLCCVFSDAQNLPYSWIKTQNGTGTDATNDVVVSSDNFVYASGSFTSSTFTIGTSSLSNSGSSDIFLSKYDTAGTLLWARKYGATGADNATTITADSLGNIYLAGSCTGVVNFGSLSFTGGNYILKIDATGTEVWVSAAATGVVISDIACDPQGNTVICGYFGGSASIGGTAVTAHGSDDGFVAKYNTSGNFTWMKIFFNSNYEHCNAVSVTPSGLIGVGGLYNSPNKLYIGNAATLDSMASTFFNNPLHPGVGIMGFVCCLQANGNYSWAKDDLNTNDAYHFASVMSVAANGSDNFYFAASTASRGLSSSFQSAWIRKYSSNGTLLFNKQLSFKSIDYAVLGGFLKPTVTFNNNKVYGADNNVVTNYTPYIQLYALRAFDDNGNALWNTLETSSTINALAVSGDAVFAGGTLTGSSFGNLTATYSGGNDGFLCRANAPVTITPLVLNTLIPDPSFCAGGSVTLAQSNTVSGGVQPYTYQWSPATGLSNANILSPVASPANTTNYILTITDAVGTILRDTVNVNVNPLPATPVISPNSNTTFCQGGSVMLTSSAGNSYLWSTGETTQSITVNNSGVFSVTTTNSFGCTSIASAPLNVTVNPLPAAPVITPGGATTFCQGGNVSLNSSAGNSYLWSTGETTQSINVNNSGNYAVQITNANGCTSPASTPVAVTVNPLPATLLITAGGPTSFCQGGNVMLTSTTGNSYLWSNGETTQSINVSNSGTFTVTTTNALGCTSLASVPLTVTVNPIPSAPVITPGGATTFCQGGNVSLSSSVGNSYLWNTGATTQSINVSNSGTFTVTTANSLGCVSLASIPLTVTVNPIPATPTITPSGATTFCQGRNIFLGSSPENNYLWNTGATTQNINVNTSGIYSVRVTNASGCTSAASLSMTVTVNPLPATPIINAGGPTTFCSGGNVILTSSAANNYLWNNGASSQNISVSASGNYSVQVTDVNGCVSAASIIIPVTVKPLPATPSISQTGNMLMSTSESTYQWYLNGSLISGATGQRYSYTSGSTYSVIVTNASGCNAVSNDYIATLMLPEENDFFHRVSPNPVENIAVIRYELKNTATVNIYMIDQLGTKVITLINDLPRPAGRHQYILKPGSLSLNSGYYFIVYVVDGKKVSEKIYIK